MRCKACKWFLAYSKEGIGGDEIEFGFCHRYPTPVEKTELGWCGEFVSEKDDEGIPSGKEWLNNE